MAKSASSTNGEAISKMEGVRRALDTMGKKAKPLAIKEFLMSNFHIDMEAGVISNYKGLILKGRKKKGKRMKAAAGVEAPKPAVHSSVKMADLQAIKSLTTRLGSEQIRELIGMFS